MLCVLCAVRYCMLTQVLLSFFLSCTQVRRIIAPLVTTLDRLDELDHDPDMASWVKEEYNGVKVLRQRILRDFFRHGFDGAGDDGGSCIDGRLTSCWNWCSKLENKKCVYTELNE